MKLPSLHRSASDSAVRLGYQSISEYIMYIISTKSLFRAHVTLFAAMWTASADSRLILASDGCYRGYMFCSCHLPQSTNNSVDHGFCVDEILGPVWTREHIE